MQIATLAPKPKKKDSLILGLLGLAALLGGVALLCGCAEMRGIPTHGGGKRFDEEQRVVAGSIRRALADMKLGELQGKNVLIAMESMAHSGGGYITYPGLQNLSGGVNGSESTGSTFYATPLLGGNNFYIPYTDNNNESHVKGWNAGASINPTLNFSSTPFSTDPDFNYLRSALTMKAQHCGINVVLGNPDINLFVLVDVLGLNRSRRDSVVYWTDTLLASCELTYYAQDAKTGKLLFRARHTSAASDYRESSVIGFTAYRIRRSIRTTAPTPLPVDGEEGPATAFAQDGKSSATLAGASPAPATLNQSVRQYLETQLRNADTQIQMNNLAQAQLSINTVRAIDPACPGLAEVEARLQQKQPGR